MTLDGKVAVDVPGNAYWPLGSHADFAELIHLRAHADLLVHGKNTAKAYRALNRSEDEGFQAKRQALNKDPHLPYSIISDHPDVSLIPYLRSSQAIQTYLVTSKKGELFSEPPSNSTVISCGEAKVEIPKFVEWCARQGYRHVLVEGGPTLIQDFLAADYLDELFLTITPKFVGGQAGITKTLLDNGLFPVEQIKKAQLISNLTYEDEIFLRYRLPSKL